MLAPSIPHHRGRDNEIRGNSRKDSFVRKLSKDRDPKQNVPPQKGRHTN